jgi:CDP-diacylglycerol--glycerol-3-phosphate 3-phosphatidyltransferase
MAKNPKIYEIDNLPNRLTVLRMLLIPVIMTCLGLNLEWSNNMSERTILILSYVAAWTFVLASITDYVDGHIARKNNIVTVFGSFLDPIADKFLVVASLILLMALGRINFVIVTILILREMYITSLRLLANDHGINVPVGALGKWKTATQMIGIPFMMAYDRPWGIPMPEIGAIVIYLSAILSVYSALEYTLGTLKKFQQKRRQALES